MDKPATEPSAVAIDAHNKENQPLAINPQFSAKIADKNNNGSALNSISGELKYCILKRFYSIFVLLIADYKLINAVDAMESILNNKLQAQEPIDQKTTITLPKVPLSNFKKQPKSRKKAVVTEDLSESEEEAAEPWKDAESTQSEDSSSDDSLLEPEQSDHDQSDHELSPESDFDDDTEAGPNVTIRTAGEGENIPCFVCKKTEDPDWILICDKCTDGYHCSCLKPVLHDIPSSETWLCPECSHEKLITALEEKLVEYDQLVKNIELAQNRAAKQERFAIMATVRQIEISENSINTRLRQRPARSYLNKHYDEQFKDIEGLEDSVVVDAVAVDSENERDWEGAGKSSQGSEKSSQGSEKSSIGSEKLSTGSEKFSQGSKKSSQEDEDQLMSSRYPRRTGKRRLLNIIESSDEEDEQPAPARAPFEGRSLRSRAKH